MKKSLIAIAAMAAAGCASAQSSVTLFGVLDVGVAHLTGTGISKTGVSTGGANISRWGFRGTEDLGGGLAASFWLEAGLDVDTGSGKGAGGGLSFNRRSTVSLSGPAGEVRLGRDDSATFLSTLIFDPFLTNGVGGNMAFIMLGAPIQISNAVSYFLPGNLGGFYGQVQYAFGEPPATATNTKQGNYAGARFGYRSGPVNAALAAGKLKGATAVQDIEIRNLGASYDLGVVKPMLLWATEKTGTAKITAVELGMTAPIGAGEVRAQVSRYNTASSNADWSKYALGYGYNLSKRTQVYGALAHLRNKDGAQKSIGVQGLTATGTTLGGNSNGYEVGIRHSF
jgi:predicted porin